MFWVSLLAAGAAYAFTTIGAQSVWLKVFALGFKVIFVALLFIGIWFAWRYLSERKLNSLKSIAYREDER
jgi:hypothetical protein